MPKTGKKKAPDPPDPLLEVYKAIQRKIHRQNTAHMFICEDDLRKVWADHPLPSILNNLNPEEREAVRNDYICVLSILIYVGWTDLSRFRPLFLREPGRDDAHLPFTNLDFLGTSGQVFLSHQHAFKPVIIEEHEESHIQYISPEDRLPFIDEPEFMGNGGYGSVAKRVIAPRCLLNKDDNKDNPEPKAVACKIYKTDIPSQDFKNEVGNLDFIKESLTDSKRVMKHIAALIHGDEFMIILPLANLYNLEIFLRGGYEPNPSTDDLRQKYDFEVEFPMLKTSVELQHAVVKEAHYLASALKWLHEDLKVFGSADRYLAHMDLKPANVLLVGDPRSPAGKWMLSDFGVSSFDKATNARSNTPSIRDVGLRFTSRGFQDRIVRGHGPYQPPEVHFDNVDNRKCDVWSFSCVLCDILAFAVGRTESVYALRNSRYGPDDDYFYETSASTKTKTQTVDDSNTKLKSEISGWWDSLESEHYSTGWVIDYINVLRNALKIKPSDRPGIGEIVQGLSGLAISRDSPASKALDTSSQISSKRPQRKRLVSQSILEAQGRRPSITLSHEPSSQQQQRESLRNIASKGGDQGQSSKKLLSPISASDRDRGFLVGHKADGSQSSSSTKILNERAAHADTPQPLLAMPERRSPSPLDEASPESTARVDISAYREEAMISISLSTKENVLAVAIASSALQVALLCKHSVHLYSTINGVRIGEPINLSSTVNWTKIRLSSRYFVVYGLGPSHKKTVRIFDLETFSPGPIVPDYSEPPQDILLSSEEVFAYVEGRCVRFYFVRRKIEQTLAITEDNAFIIRANFNASGKILCVWATGTRADHAYFIGINEEQASATLCGKGSYQKIDTYSATYNIWPCPDSPACVIHEAHGGAFIAHPLDQPQREPQKTNSVDISNALTACVVREDLLVCLRSRTLHFKRELCGFALLQESRGPRRIANQSRDMCVADKNIQKSTATAARLVNGKSELVLCTTTGKVLRYVQS